MYKQFKAIHDRFPNPKGIIIFSAHWEEEDWTILDHDNPPLYYDYGNFPPQAYNLSFKMSSSV
jgi:aromatic ring-opening dioxygenase catalytic subunit (LigB family)